MKKKSQSYSLDEDLIPKFAEFAERDGYTPSALLNKIIRNLLKDTK